MLLCPLKFPSLTGADSKLENASVSRQIPAAPDDAGVGQGLSQIVLSEIRMGIEMDNRRIRVLFVYSPKAPKCHQMLSSQHKGAFACL